MNTKIINCVDGALRRYQFPEGDADRQAGYDWLMQHASNELKSDILDVDGMMKRCLKVKSGIQAMTGKIVIGHEDKINLQFAGLMIDALMDYWIKDPENYLESSSDQKPKRKTLTLKR